MEYTLVSGSVTQIKITDTLGNIVLYKDEQIDPDAKWYMGGVVHPLYRYNRLWTLSLNGDELRQYYCLTGKDTKNYAYQKLIGTIDAEENCTRYQSAGTTVKYNCYISSPATNDSLAGRVSISYIYYPNGLEQKIYSSSPNKMPNERLGMSGYVKWSPVKDLESSYKDADGVKTPGEARTYAIGDYSCMYEAADTNGEYEYRATVKDRYRKVTPSGTFFWNLRSTMYTFDNEHLKQSETHNGYPDIQYDDINSQADFDRLIHGNQDATLSSSAEYRYNSSRLPSAVDERLYNENGQTYRSVDHAYTYDMKGNILTETLPNNQKITYTYKYDYSIPLTKTYKQDASTTIVEENTLTADGKGVSTHEVKSNGAVVARTGYVYDTKGRLTNQRVFTDDTNYTEQTFAYGSTAAGPVEQRTLNVKDAQGVAVAGSPGYSAGVLAEKTTYNARGLPIKLTDANGNATTFNYDSTGRVTRTDYPGGAYEHYVYDDKNSTVTFTDRLGTVYRYQYDAWGNLSQVYDVARDCALSDQSYDTWNRLISDVVHRTAGGDMVTAYRCDLMDRVTDKKSKSASGEVLYQETYAYADDSGKTTKTVVGDASAPSVVTTSYTDVMGNTVKTGRMLGSTELVDTFTYDYLGNCTQNKSAYTAGIGGAFTTKTAYDYAGRAVSVTNALNETAATGYDWQGNQISATDPKGNTSLYTYDALGRLLTQRVPLEGTTYAATRYSYDPNGSVTAKATQNSAPAAAESWTSTEYAYDNMNQLVRVTGHADASHPSYTQYYYDKAGNILRMYTGQASPLTVTGLDQVSGTVDSVTKYGYDAYGNQTSMTDPLGKTETYTYDLDGAVLTKKDRNGNTTTYTYDAIGRLLSQKAAGTISYTYTQTGQKRTETDGQTAAYTYDSLGRVLTETVGSAVKTYAYNKADLRTAFILKVNNVQQLSNTYGYDALGRVVTVSGSNVSATYGYDTNGNQSYVQYGNGLREDYAYNKANLVTQVANKKGSTVLSRYDYAYLLDGNQRTKTELDGTVTSYAYDGLGRLLTENAVKGGKTVSGHTYTYDSRNNRASMAVTGAENLRVNYTYDNANRLLKSVGTPTGGAAETTAYTYDNNGNRLTAAKKTQELDPDPPVEQHSLSLTGLENGDLWQYTHDGFGRQTAVRGGSHTNTYTYGPGGLRTGKTVDGKSTSYVWDDQQIVLEQGAATTKYVRGLNLIANVGTATSYYLYNAHGDVVQLANTTGTVTKTYKYDAFGVEEAPASGDTNPFRYCGEQYDPETGTVYLRARYYDVGNGRFTTEDTHWGPGNMVYGDNPAKWNEQKKEDPLGLNTYTYVPSDTAIRQGGNLYVYCINDPIRWIDPLGLVTFGVGLNANIALLLRVEGNVAIVWDDDGNVGLLGNLSGGAGTPTIGGATNFTITAADTIYDLRSWGGNAGLSACLAPFTPGVGIDYVNVGLNSMIPGVEFSYTVDAKPWAEGHAVGGYTWVVGFNPFGFFKDMFNSAKSDLRGAWDNLDRKDQDTILEYLGIDSLF